MTIEVYSDAEREYQRMLVKARTYTKFAGLKPEIATNPEAIVAIMWTLRDYGLSDTITAINMAYDWIEGRAEPSAMLFVAVARQHGYQIEPVVRTAEKALARVTLLGRSHFQPVEVAFTIEDAIASHRLDEWVEKWNTTEKGRRWPTRQVVAINSRAVENLPEWADALVKGGQVKRYDAWWNYRTDMMWKSAAKRAVKVACPHVLLGGSDADMVWSDPPGRYQPPVIDTRAVEVAPDTGATSEMPDDVHDSAPEARGYVDADDDGEGRLL